jgi:Ca2+/Na+ antiporter
MLSFFDRMYLQLYLLRTSDSDSKKRDWASSILTLLQSLNALTLCLLLGLVRSDIRISKLVMVIVCIILMVFNYVRYQYSEKRNPANLQELFSRKSGSIEVGRNNFLLLYILGTLATCIVFIILYSNSQPAP